MSVELTFFAPCAKGLEYLLVEELQGLGAQQVREALEKVLQLQFEGIDDRLDRIEVLMERLERRLWLTVYGVVGTILAQAASQLITMTPNGGM